MRMALQLLRSGRVSRLDHDETLRLLERQLDQLLDNIDDVSALLRAKGGAKRPEPVEDDLAPLLDMVCGRSSLARLLDERGQSLQCAAPDDPVSTRHDPALLSALLEYLILRVAKSTPSGAKLKLELAQVGECAAFQLRGAQGGLTADHELAYVMALPGASPDAEPETKTVLMREFLGISGATISFIEEGTGISLTLPALPH